MSAQPLRAVLFDLDGTLADSEPLIAQAIRGMLHDRGHDVSLQAVTDALGPPLEGMVEALIGRAPAPDEYEEMRLGYLERYNRTIDRVQPLPCAPALLDALQAAGIAACVVTNKRESGAHEQLEAMGWGERFPIVIGADPAGVPKPAPEPALEALRRLDVPAAEAAFIGDTDTDMRCALLAGIPLRVGLTHVRTPELLRAGGATHLCDTLAAVHRILLEA